MCTCNGKTPHCNDCCECVNWTNPDEWLEHIRENFTIERDALTYDSPAALETVPAVLCVLGKCNKCGRQICIGGELKDVLTFNALVERLFRDVFCCDKSNETKIEDAVIALLHEDDREQALDWIHMNRYRMGGSQISGLNPKFNERVRHVPGYTLDICKSIYTGLGPDEADLNKIAALTVSDIDWLREQHSLRVRREKEIVSMITEFSHSWDRYALETRMFGEALEIALTERTRHTGNQWIESADGRVIKHEISNAVYVMNIYIESPDPRSVLQMWSVRWELTLNVPYAIAARHGTEIIAKGRKKSIYRAEDIKKYIDGRKKGCAKYFIEIYPIVPREYTRYFSVNGILLPEYTAEIDEESKEAASNEKDV